MPLRASTPPWTPPLCSHPSLRRRQCQILRAATSFQRRQVCSAMGFPSPDLGGLPCRRGRCSLPPMPLGSCPRPIYAMGVRIWCRRGHIPAPGPAAAVPWFGWSAPWWHFWLLRALQCAPCVCAGGACSGLAHRPRARTPRRPRRRADGRGSAVLPLRSPRG
ncbi:hypothetical protein PVAP13_9KG061380 [Panicum virgatum]|uniref:Uncharacterized protein n=1 Tax=Panicum virgatum TaxID=38727 RepID=A0A8T0NDW0_PANVG|nr:hypothetical protein PVAP13_9KG061380 [Panicum virgatum]